MPRKLAAKIPPISPLAPGWFFVRGRHPLIENLRRDAAFNFMSRHHPALRYGAIFLLLPYWFLRGAALARKFTRQFGAIVEEVSGKGKMAQFCEQWFLSIWYSIHPCEYHAFRLYNQESRNKFDLYFYRAERDFIAGSRAMQAEWGAVQDKILFEKFCSGHGFSCIPTLCRADKADKTKPEEIAVLARERPLFLKPQAGYGGYGCFSLRYLENGRYLVNQALFLSREDLKDFLAGKFLNSAYLVQPLVANHPELHDISNGSLCALRIITLLPCPGGEAEYLLGIFQSPIKKMVTCNLGLYCPVDTETGKLGAGFFSLTSYATASSHPAGKGVLPGRALPFWNEAKKLALSAHTALGGVAALGWDVALTENGPLLLEANSGWDPMAIQQAFDKPLGETRLPAVLKSYRESTVITRHPIK
jgi:hypothetical protein